LAANCHLRIVPLTEEPVRKVRIACQACVDLGRGNHPAEREFGDCCANVLAKATGDPPPLRGKPFRATDVEAAVAPER
jgi:uncharacterized protein with PIN domain